MASVEYLDERRRARVAAELMRDIAQRGMAAVLSDIECIKLPGRPLVAYYKGRQI